MRPLVWWKTVHTDVCGAKGIVFQENPSISAKISIIIPFIVLFYQKISLYEGFFVFLQRYK